MNPLLAALRTAVRDPRGRTGLAFLALLALLTLVAPIFLPDPAAQPDPVGGSNLAPSLLHLFGTDALSRDVLSRVIWGARVSLAIALLAVALSISLGAMVGIAAGYFGGAVDSALMRLVDGALAIPRLFLLLLVLAVWEQIPVAMLVVFIGATGWFGTSRLVRAEVLRIREESYVRAAEALGAPRRRIILRHLLPNALGPLLVAAMLGVGDVILVEAGLSFLGLGVQPPTPSWGGMILDAKSVLVTAPWNAIFPGLAIFGTVLAANLFGDALRDAVDPRSA